MAMILPTLEGTIRRRLLINFRVDPDVIARVLPNCFRPRLVGQMAMAGICLIRLEDVRPRGFPAFVGLNSENAAHRIAVEWTDPDGTPRQGVYIPRRDSASFVNRMLGGRVFPGEHSRARFVVRDTENCIDLTMRSDDGSVEVDLQARTTPDFASASFPGLEDASAFFQGGAVGYSQTRGGRRLDGVKLETRRWSMSPLAVDRVHSSFFSDRNVFPQGAAEFDSALIMRDIAHEWHSASSLTV